MSNVYNINASGGIRVPLIAGSPGTLTDGLIWYDTTANSFKRYENGSTAALSGTPVFSDADFVIYKAGDTTAKVVVSAAAIPTATTRTITMPNANVNLGLISSAIQSSEKGAVNGVATLDANGRIPVTQLATAIMTYEGVYNASTNSPVLSDAGGNTTGDVPLSPGQVFRVGTAGSQNFGSGSISFEVGDYVIYNGTTWEKSDTTDAIVNAINQLTGDVTASAATGSQSKATTVAAIQGVTVSGTTGTGNVAFSASPTFTGTVVAAAIAATGAVSGSNLSGSNTGDQTITLTGGVTGSGTGSFAATVVTNANLTGPVTSTGNATAIADGAIANAKLVALTASKVVQTGAGGVIEASGVTTATLAFLDATSSVQTQLDSKQTVLTSTQTLTASQTNATAASFTFAHATYNSSVIEYSIKEATTNRVRTGQLYIATDGTTTSLTDTNSETGNCGVTWDLSISGANVLVRYTTTANNKTMKAVQKLY